MAIISVYQHGVRMGTPGMNKNPPKRGRIGGWTSQSSRRNSVFLQSVVISQLTGWGFAFTLTLRHCPESSDDWRALRKAYFMRLCRAGAIRGHWVTEWQARGCPHLHGCVYFPDTGNHLDFMRWQTLIRDAWLFLAKPYKPAKGQQKVYRVTDTLGWLRYTAKHADRGAWHYQRSPENIPKSWQMKTGRIWGKFGDWPTRDRMRFEVSREWGFRFRRLVRAWAIADARGEKYPKSANIEACRRMLKCNQRALSEVRGVGRWCPQSVTLELIGFLSDAGAEVEQVE